MLDDEAGRLAFIRRLAWSLSAVGFGLMVSSVLFSTASDSTVGQPVLVIIGGYLVGVSSFCFTSLRQWPVLRRCLDVDRIRADHEKPAS